VKSYICIHGHYYQPPRENAWLEVIERQESAFPYHNWNARIAAECYGPNGASRILNEENKIIDIVNNYQDISFNFGPTLLSWMELYDKDAYEAVIMADMKSRQRFGGHGNALAQVYNHIIMPLATPRDRNTQIIWGIADFEKRFNRKPEGMWLAETAVDTATLELLAQHNILFTILAPRQAKAFRKLNDDQWQTINENQLDTAIPYAYKLPSGRTIALFFYNGQISREVAFNGLLNSGKLFADRLIAATRDTEQPQLIHIATDGESYGHHHYRGDMALASCIDYLKKNKSVYTY
jgi:alpha-amylase/alpha-mannosidase (GH57 family)